MKECNATPRTNARPSSSATSCIALTNPTPSLTVGDSDDDEEPVGGDAIEVDPVAAPGAPEKNREFLCVVYGLRRLSPPRHPVAFPVA